MKIDLRQVRLAMIGLIVCLSPMALSNSFAQEKPSESSRSGRADRGNDNDNQRRSDSLEQQLRQLQAKVAQLEAILKQQRAGQSQAGSDMSAIKMGGMKKKLKGMMKGMKSEGTSDESSSMKMGMKSGGMGMGKGGMSGMKDGGMGMGMMGRMKGMGAKGTGQMKMASSLPGFPGASHIYHVGATGFFLNHSDHITLTPEQQGQLNKVKEAALLSQGTFDRRIEEAEQQLWVLTGSDSPDATAIEARVGEIAKLSAEKRIVFIQAVGKATGVLTQEQRQTLIGLLPPEHTAAAEQ